MDFYRNNKWHYSNVLLLLSLTFQLFVVAAPVADYTNLGNTSMARNQRAFTYMPIPLSDGEKIFYITAVAGNETINENESNLILSKNTLGFKGLVLRFFKIFNPFIILGVLVLFFGYVIRKIYQRISILATSLGGHSPPYRLLTARGF